MRCGGARLSGDALSRLGFGAQERERLRPGLVDVSLNAYGWTGPWRNRRGFDSLVKMSTGIAAESMRRGDRDAPFPLPVQALDHATGGYLMAAAATQGLAERQRSGHGCEVRVSLARTAATLIAAGERDFEDTRAPETAADLSPGVEDTACGPARRVKPPLSIDGIPMRWDRPAGSFDDHPATWE